MSLNGSGAGDRDSRAEGLNIGWAAMSYPLAGLIAYGAIGWLIGKAVHIAALFPIGMLVGIVISLGYVIFRFGRQGSVESVERNDR
jgi:hypothetical protein